MMTYTICGVQIEARNISWFWGLWTNTIVRKGVIYSKQWWMLSLNTQFHEYIHIIQETEIGYIKFRLLYVWYWFAKGGYKNIPFEREAKENNNEDYILSRPKNAWRKYL